MMQWVKKMPTEHNCIHEEQIQGISRKTAELEARADYKEKRIDLKKSITLLSYEYELDSGNISRIENGKIEPKLSMMWRLSEALNMPLSSIIKEVEERLGEDFNIINQ